MNLFALQAGQNAQYIFGSEPLSPLSPLAADQTGGGGTDFGAEVPANTPSPPPGDGGDVDPTNLTEEKRRRNTAASGTSGTFLGSRRHV